MPETLDPAAFTVTVLTGGLAWLLLRLGLRGGLLELRRTRRRCAACRRLLEAGESCRCRD
jgi:hypothetical protein